MVVTVSWLLVFNAQPTGTVISRPWWERVTVDTDERKGERDRCLPGIGGLGHCATICLDVACLHTQ